MLTRDEIFHAMSEQNDHNNDKSLAFLYTCIQRCWKCLVNEKKKVYPIFYSLNKLIKQKLTWAKVMELSQEKIKFHTEREIE